MIKFYRYLYRDNKLDIDEFISIKETPMGHWIVPAWCDSVWYKSSGPLIDSPYKRWISNTSRKRYAYPTKEEALKNYILRTKRYLLILNASLKRANIGLQLALTLEQENVKD